ncbi:hypothetical protein HALA3H3_830126 [Halomonas sp. A3H3]|nr:hypothetical protein HALA3H3_830126 [Halomonas sp. A3H3]
MTPICTQIAGVHLVYGLVFSLLIE